MNVQGVIKNLKHKWHWQLITKIVLKGMYLLKIIKVVSYDDGNDKPSKQRGRPKQITYKDF